MRTYEPVGNLEDADCVIGHSFGTSINEGSVNHQLANVLVESADGRPKIADRTLVDAKSGLELEMAHIVGGDVTNIRAQGVGTWGTLVEAQQYMHAEGLSRPIMVAQAYHISRVVRQAARLGMHSIVPENLPKNFDKQSQQIWTRSPYLWFPFNALGSILLKKRGQL